MSDRPVDRVLNHPSVKGISPLGDSGTDWTAHCPAHEDSNKSLSIGVGRDEKVILKCFAGCSAKDISESIGLKLSDLFSESDLNAKDRDSGITVKRLAFMKRLPDRWLRAHAKLRDAAPGEEKQVFIPYFSRGGLPLFERKRSALSAKEGTRQAKGVSLVPYGLWLLDGFGDRKKLIIVEGETDAWSLWYNGYSCLGIPGSSATACLDPNDASGFEEIFVWREPDPAGNKAKAGEKFVTDLTDIFRRVGREVKVLSRDGIKDPSELHVRFTSHFREQFELLLAAAKPLSDSTAPAASLPKGTGHIVIPAGLPPRTVANGVLPPPRDYTDEGNADRLVDRYGGDFRWVDSFGHWLVWDGNRWMKDEHHQVRNWCEDTIKAVFTEAIEEPDEFKQVLLLKHGSSSRSAAAKSSMEKLAKDKPGVPLAVDQLDCHKHLLNCPNGTVDLRTGEMLPSRREDFITRSTTVPYNPNAKCPLWDKSLTAIFPIAPGEPTGNKATITYVQRLMGLAISGWIEPILPIFHGGGANGKSTILATIQAIVGNGYASPAPKDFLTPRAEQHPAALADLLGRRLVYATETERRDVLSASLVKWLTGGDAIKARYMGKDWFDFLPTHTLILSTNHAPRIPDSDDGIWRRIAFVGFESRFWNPDKGETGPEHLQQDPRLIEKLQSEYEGILAWLVRGAMEYYRDGLPQTKEIMEQTKLYRSSEDTIGQFAEEVIERSKGDRVLYQDVYRAYKSWCESNSEFAMGSRNFGKELRRMRIRVERSSGNKMCCFDIRIAESSYANRKTGGLDDLDY